MNRRALVLASLLAAGAASLAAPPPKRAATNPPAPAAPAPPQVVRNWSFSLQKDGRSAGRFHGGTAVVVAPRLFDVQEMSAETFRADGEGDITAESPACRVEVTTNGGFVVTSAGALKLAQADGRFGLTGEGFRWDHGAQRLVVSNKVDSFLVIPIPRLGGAETRKTDSP